MRKLLFTLLAFVTIFTSSLSLFAPAAHAQWYKQTYAEWSSIVFDEGNPSELFGERYAAAQTRWIVYSLASMILESDIFNCFLRSQTNPGPATWQSCADLIQQAWGADASITQTKGLAIFSINRPISSLTYFKDIANRLHFVPEAKAQQGFGFDEAAQVVLQLWKAARNTTYGLLILVIIVMAFMIMFRVKISPQAVITVQSALPKVIMTLILITFSFAIAGLLIDLMYVVIGLVAAILREGGISTAPDWGTLFEDLTTDNTVWSLLLKFLLLFAPSLFLALTGNALGALGLFLGATELIWLIITVVVTVILLILGFRIVWMLLKNFVLILLSIITGPLQILFGAFGGGGFSAWLTNLAALLAVYPVTGFMFVLAFIFLRGATADNPIVQLLGDGIWPFHIASLIDANTWQPPLMGGTAGDATILWLGTSVATIALIPKAADLIKSLVTGKPFAYGTGIGEGFGFVTAGYAAGLGGIKDAASDALKQRINPLLKGLGGLSGVPATRQQTATQATQIAGRPPAAGPVPSSSSSTGAGGGGTRVALPTSVGRPRNLKTPPGGRLSRP